MQILEDNVALHVCVLDIQADPSEPPSDSVFGVLPPRLARFCLKPPVSYSMCKKKEVSMSVKV